MGFAQAYQNATEAVGGVENFWIYSIMGVIGLHFLRTKTTVLDGLFDFLGNLTKPKVQQTQTYVGSGEPNLVEQAKAAEATLMRIRKEATARVERALSDLNQIDPQK